MATAARRAGSVSAVELRVVAGPRQRAHIDQLCDVMGDEQPQKIIDRPRRMAHRQRLAAARIVALRRAGSRALPPGWAWLKWRPNRLANQRARRSRMRCRNTGTSSWSNQGLALNQAMLRGEGWGKGMTRGR